MTGKQRYVRKKRYGSYAWVLEDIPEVEEDTAVAANKAEDMEVISDGMAETKDQNEQETAD